MKKFGILTIAILALVSCINKDDDPLNENSFFEYEIANKQYKAEGLYAYAIVDENSFTIYGTEDIAALDNAILTYIVVNEDKGTGSYNLKAGADGIGYHTNEEGSFTYYTLPEESSGIIEITLKTDDRIKGNFSFTALDPNSSDSITISQGKFDVAIR